MDWFSQVQPDILCLQETRLLPEEAPTELCPPAGYDVFWNPAEKRGYSGTAVFTKIAPDSTTTLGIPEFDSEGRAQLLHFKDFTLVNTYWPNSQSKRNRLPYKLSFCSAIDKELASLVKKGRNVIICGDYNIAHREIDLARPKSNENNAGYYVEEREAMTTFLDNGFVDVFRHFHPETVGYTWWSYRTRARARNIGWRLDYHCVNTALLPQVQQVTLHDDVLGSDHCPVSIQLKGSKKKRKAKAS